MPYDVPVEHMDQALEAKRLVRTILCQVSGILVNLVKKGRIRIMADKIRIDVLTLDSVQCAACGYMMESIAALPGDVQEMIVYQEWSIKNKDGNWQVPRTAGQGFADYLHRARPRI